MPKPISGHEASILLVIALAPGSKDVPRGVAQLKSKRANHIAELLLGKTFPKTQQDVDDLEYFTRWTEKD